jgi:hypothetical protein
MFVKYERLYSALSLFGQGVEVGHTYVKRFKVHFKGAGDCSLRHSSIKNVMFAEVHDVMRG